MGECQYHLQCVRHSNEADILGHWASLGQRALASAEYKPLNKKDDFLHLKFEILQVTWKNETKNIRLLVFSFLPIEIAFWCFFFVVCKISNFDMWTDKHLTQGSWTDLALKKGP